MISFTVPIPPAGLGQNDRLHWSKKKRLRDEYSIEVAQRLFSGSPFVDSLPWRKALRLTLDWHQVYPYDLDGAVGRAKTLIDCLGMAPEHNAGTDRFYCGLFEDDAQITQLSVNKHRAEHKRDQCVRVTMEEIEE